jgi:UDP-glucose 4-epimerase
MKIALTGATGRVGYPITRHLVALGHHVTTLGRRPLLGIAHLPWDLTEVPPDLTGTDALVHAAFAHIPNRYRGGEGDEPQAFRDRNLDGTLQLFATASACGVGRIIYLSSRAVYDGYPAGSILAESLPARPQNLYGVLKAEVEDWLAAAAGPGLAVASLRATGVYGPGAPGQPHKWRDMFESYAKGVMPRPGIGSEVHEDDVAAAIALLLTVGADRLSPAIFNVSDIVLDRRDLLAAFNDATGNPRPLPERSDPATVSVMRCDRLCDLGWQPRGITGLQATVQSMTSG